MNNKKNVFLWCCLSILITNTIMNMYLILEIQTAVDTECLICNVTFVGKVQGLWCILMKPLAVIMHSNFWLYSSWKCGITGKRATNTGVLWVIYVHFSVWAIIAAKIQEKWKECNYSISKSHEVLFKQLGQVHRSFRLYINCSKTQCYTVNGIQVILIKQMDFYQKHMQ